jgi:hypothetical protein
VTLAPSEVAPDAPGRPTLRHRPVARDQPSVNVPNLQHIEAVTTFFQCDPKVPRLRVMVDSKQMTFTIPNANSIIVRNSPEGAIDFNCDAQKPVKIGIFYLPWEAGAKVDGTITELVF